MTITGKVYEISKDGLPREDDLTGRLAFIFDGEVFFGWPLFNIHLKYPENNHPVYSMNDWEASSDLLSGVFHVTHYVIFDQPFWEVIK